MSEKAYTSASAFPEQQKGTHRLYSSRLCPFSERARLVLRHKNVPYETININTKDKPKWFSSINPVGGVPAFSHDGNIIYESVAVAEYVDDVFPGDKLQPSNPLRKAQDRVLLEQIGKIISPFLGIVLVNADSEEKKADHEQKVDQILKALQYYESKLSKRCGPFFGGNSLAMVDFYIWTPLERLPALTKDYPRADLFKFPKVAAWWKTMSEVPSVKDIMRDADWHYEVLKMHRTGHAIEAADYGLKE